MKELTVRTISGVVFVAAIVASLLLSSYLYLVLFSLFLALAMYEYLNLTIEERKILLKSISIVCGLLLFAVSFLISGYLFDVDCTWPVIVLVFLVLMLPIINLYYKNYRGLGNAFASILYIAVPFSALNFAAFANDAGFFNGWTILTIMFFLWSSDVGAYCAGTWFGQGVHGHKLFPSVSPKKSWEGIIGGAVVTASTALLLCAFDIHTLIGISKGDLFILAAVIFVFGIYGDLVESQLKRSFGVKDSGNIMPGHGGMLDRFDSALLAFPAASLFYLISYYLN